jgi:hypothetical protein
MDRQTQVPVEQYLKQMRVEFEQAMRRVIEAVNAAPDGRWINGSEVEVRDVMADFRRKAFQTALQMRVDAAEGAFSPGGSGGEAKEAEQGARAALDADDQRAGGRAASPLPLGVRGQQHAKRRSAGRHA